MSDAYYALDREWRLTEVNPAAEQIIGRSRAELVGTNLWETFPFLVDTPIAATLHRVQADQVAVSQEWYYPPLARWFALQIYPSSDGLEIFFREITDVRDLEGAVRATEAHYQSFVEHLPAAVYLLAADANQTPLYFSPAITAVTGETPDEAMAFRDHWLELVHPDDRARVAAEDARTTATGEPFRMLYRHRHKDGGYVWVRDECVPVVDAAGTIVSWQGILLDVGDQIAAQQALAESEARFRTAFENAPIGMALVHPEGAFLRANRALCTMLGMSEEQLLSTTFQQITHPDDLAADLAQTRRAIDGQISSFALEKRYIRADGQNIWVRIVTSFLRDGDDAPLYFITQIEDITARKAAADALAHERDLLHTLMDLLPDAVYVKDTASRFLRLNPAAAATLGLEDPTRALGRTDFDFFPEALARRFLADEQQVITTGTPLLNRLEPQQEGDTATWWLTSTVPWRDASGAVVGIIGAGRDITERLRTEEALRASEARHRALLTALPDLVFRFDRAGTYLDVKAERLSDLTAPPKDVLGRRLADVLPEDVAILLLEAIAQVLTTRQPSTREYDLELAGERRSFEARLVAEGLDEIVAVVRDVTDRHRHETELRAALAAAEAASHATRQFLAMMSHELRTPLQAILGYAELLLADAATPLTPAQADDVQTIHAGASRLVALIAQMLDLSRLEAGQFPLRSEPVNVATVLGEIQQQVTPQAAIKGLRVRIDLPGQLPPVLGDELGIYHVLLNLVGNAVKFTETGEVSVRATAADGEVIFTVHDTGIGIANEDLALIFTPFRQVQHGMTRRYEGAGLGLAIVQQLVDQQGGRIHVTSQLGEGSTFTVTLPVAPLPGL